MGSTGWSFSENWIDRNKRRWLLGSAYIVAVASIWIAASYIVQSVEDAGISPFLITYICNSLFMIYIPLVEVARYFDDSSRRSWIWWNKENETNVHGQHVHHMENAHLLLEMDHDSNSGDSKLPGIDSTVKDSERILPSVKRENVSKQVDAEERWTRTRVAKVSLLICPFWFLAQLGFNLSLEYTTVTSNTILSSTSSLFTFLVSLAFLGEAFTWVKLISVLLCMGGTVIVSLGDSKTGAEAIAPNPLLGDSLSLASAAVYAIYITLIRKKLPDEEKGEGKASTAEFLGYLGFFNFLIFLPFPLVLHLVKRDAFANLKWKEFGLIVGKGLLDNVFSDYLWVKATQLTSTTVATAGLSMQVPIAAAVDTIIGRAPGLLEYLGAALVMLGFAGFNIPSDSSSRSQTPERAEEEGEGVAMVEIRNTSTS